MLAVRLYGGLGNTIFQYALYRALCLNGKEVYIDMSYFKNERVPAHLQYHLDQFNTNISEIDKNAFPNYVINRKGLLHQALRIIKFNCSKIYFEKQVCTYDSNIFNLENKYLEGYWQSEKYFKHFRPQLLKELTYIGEWSSQNLKYRKQIEQSESVCVHIRRGDYLAETTRYGNVSESTYYERAISYIEQHINNPLYFMFTNDVNWCKEKFHNIKNIVFVEGNDIKQSYMDMVLMTYCKHHIIANSTFSWWGAWLTLNDGITIAPQIWYNNANTPDIWCDKWIKL